MTDLRNKYSEIETALSNGPVVLTKNGYGASGLVSISLFDKLMAKQALYEAISTSEAEIDAGHCSDAKAGLAKSRALLHI